MASVTARFWATGTAVLAGEEVLVGDPDDVVGDPDDVVGDSDDVVGAVAVVADVGDEEWPPLEPHPARAREVRATAIGRIARRLTPLQ
jgi:hypothetical protein